MYLVIVFILFVIQLILTIALLVEKDDVIQLAISYSNEEDQESINQMQSLLNTNIEVTSYILLGSCGLILSVFLMGWWYRQSMIMRKKDLKLRKMLGDLNSEEELELEMS